MRPNQRSHCLSRVAGKKTPPDRETERDKEREREGDREANREIGVAGMESDNSGMARRVKTQDSGSMAFRTDSDLEQFELIQQAS